MPSATRSLAPIVAVVALAAAVGACRARAGERCICAEDCGDNLLCVAEGRVLQAGECSPVGGADSNPGMCVEQGEALEDGGDGGVPEIWMDLGSKRDFEPGTPPEMTTEPATDSGTSPTTSGSSTDTGSSSSGSGSSTGTGSGSSGSGSSSGSTSSGT